MARGTRSFARLRGRIRAASIAAAIAYAAIVVAAPGGALAEGTSTSVVCDPGHVIVGAPTTCTVTVDGAGLAAVPPRGRVIFNTGGFIESPTADCQLNDIKIGSQYYGRCSTRIVPRGAGAAFKVYADYQGGTVQAQNSSGIVYNINYTASRGITEYSSEARRTAATVSCTTPTILRGLTTCTATIADTGPGLLSSMSMDLAPRGTVTISPDNAAAATLPGSNAVDGTCTPQPTAPGATTSSCSVAFEVLRPEAAFRARYAVGGSSTGVHTDAQGNSGNTVTANQRPTTTRVSCDQPSTGLNVPVPCRVVVTDTQGGHTPTGIANLVTPMTDIANRSFDPQAWCVLTGTGNTAGCTVNYTPIGAIAAGRTDTIKADYGGDQLHASSSATTTVGVSPTKSFTSITCDKTDFPVSDRTFCTATVTSGGPAGSPAPGGEIYFSSSADGFWQSQAHCTLSAGKCTLSYFPHPADSGFRTDTLTATYWSNDSLHSNSVGNTTVRIYTRPTTISIDCPETPVGDLVDCAVTAADADPDVGSRTYPQGIITPTAYYQDTFGVFMNYCGSAQIQYVGGYTAKCTIGYRPPVTGVNKISVALSPERPHGGSTSGQVSVIATKHPTSASVSCASAPAGDLANCSVVVTDTNPQSKRIPGGVVNFAVADGPGSFETASCTLSAYGYEAASCVVRFARPSVGTSRLTASYEGGVDHTGSGSQPADASATKHPTSTDVACPPAPVGEHVSCTFVVSDANPGAAANPAGTLTVTSGAGGAFDAQTCTLAASPGSASRASCDIGYTATAVGANSVAAGYSGSGEHTASSSSNETATATKRASATTIDCPATSVASDVTCTVTVRDAGAGAKRVPAGTVGLTGDAGGSFLAPAACTLQAVAGSSDTARCTGSYVPKVVGTNRVTAAYAGGAFHDPSGSPATDVAAAAQACKTASGATFLPLGVEQCFTVPADVSRVSVVAVGAPSAPAAAKGHRVDGTVSVTPGGRLFVQVGGMAGGRNGGFNGGGNGGPIDVNSSSTPYDASGGGGASDVRTCSLADCAALATSDTRLIVAAGAGGRGGQGAGGVAVGAGGAAGAGGGNGSVGAFGGYGGGAASTTAGGAGGANGFPATGRTSPGGNGTRGNGGNGGQGTTNAAGGGGGGGYFGGGGGGGGFNRDGGGAGGGSSLVPTGGTLAGDSLGASSVVIRYHHPVNEVSVQLSSTSMVANGTSETTATATLRDADGNLALGEDVVFSSNDPGHKFGPVKDNRDGTYTAKVTSSTTAGESTITATDQSVTPGVPGTVKLTQTAGPAKNVTVTLTPAAITANGTDTAVAKATVKDANGNLVKGDNVTFASSDTGQSVSTATNNGDGTYSATVRASSSVGDKTITATDRSVTPNVSGTGVVTQLAQCRTPASGTVATFAYSGGEECYKVPAGAKKVKVVATGASGAQGGGGAQVSGLVSVEPGDTLYVNVGGTGSGRNGGYNGGGLGGDGDVGGTLIQYVGYGGGGASDVRTCRVTECPLAPGADRRLVVAAGGGGRGSGTGYSSEIAPGGKWGAAGGSVGCGPAGGPGGAGTDSAGGGPGAFGEQAYTSWARPTGASAGERGRGGRGGEQGFYGGGGGGGGGYFGGGGGGSAHFCGGGGGGGGSNLVPAGGSATDAAGAASVTITSVGDPVKVDVELTPGEITADGTMTATVKASVLDANEIPVPGQTVSFDSSDDDHVIDGLVDHQDGTFSATIKASTLAGESTITATAGSHSGTAKLKQKAGLPTGLEVTLDKATITANGTDEATATATLVDAYGNRVSGETVAFASNRTEDVVQVQPASGNGVYTARVRSTKSGTSTITATVRSLSKPIDLAKTPGPPYRVDLALARDTITADGSDSSDVTVTVVDAHGNPVPDRTVAFSTNGRQTFGSATDDDHDGVYPGKVTSSQVAGKYTLRATVDSAIGTTDLTEIAGPATGIALTLAPDEITADGVDKTTATATVTDQFGNGVKGRAVEVASDDGRAIAAPHDNGDGTYSVDVTSSRVAGVYDLTATSGALPSVPAKLTEKPGPATGIALALAPDEITADGVDKTSATATVTDQFGNGVKGRAVEVASDDGRAIAAPHDNGDGTYSVDVTSSRVAGVYDLTATSGALPSVPAKLTQKPGPAAVLKLVLAPDEITADGDDATTAKVTVKDQYGNGVPQVALTYSTTGTQDFGTTVDNGDGTYSTPVRAGIVAGDYHITVAGASLTTTEPLKEKPGPAKTLKLIFDPASVTANGTDKTTAKIVLTDKKGNGVPGKEIAFATSGGQTFGDASDDGGGAYSASVTASKVAGEYEITASAGSVPGMATLTEKPGPATGIALALDPDEITADGVDDTEATVTVTDQYGNGVPGRTVAITSEDGRTIAAPADNADGTYTVTVLSSKVANDYDLTATSGTLTSTAATLTEKPGPATSIVLALDPTTITADGTESTTATVTIEDQYGNGVLGRTVGVSSDDGRTIAAPADNGDGTYTVTVLSSKVAKDYDLTATSGSLTSVAATLTEVAGPAANLAVELDQAEVTANKLDTTKATATVTDKHGNLISGDDVDFSSSEDDQTIGATTDNKDGTYTATITSTTKAGEVTITGADGSLTGPAKLTQKPGPAVSLDLALHPDTITADEADGTDAIATVEDAFGNGVPGQTVRFSADGGQAVGGMTDNKDGTYTARVTSTKRAGRSTVTSASGLLAAAAPLTQIAGAPASVKLELERDSITADGDTVTNAIAKVVDANGNPVRGGRLNFASDAGNPLGQVVDNGDGTYTVAIRATRRSGRATLTATAGQASDSARLTQRPGPAARLRLALDRATIAANGTDTARATATITDINDNLVSGESVRFTSTDSGHAIGASADNGDGTYTATITASRQAGAATISAGSGSLSHAVTLTQSNLNTDLAESERTGPRFRVKRPAAARADSRGYVTVPSAWLICPRGVVSCMLNARIDARPLEADDPLPTRRQSVFASRVSTVFAPGTARIKLRLSRGARRLLRQNGRLQMTVVAVATGHIGGAQARMQKTFVVRPPKPKPAR